MIFVTIGVASEVEFNRLIEEMDRIAGEIDEEVVMQIGNTRYAPKNARYVRFLTRDKIEGFHKKARVIVSHAGVGSILTALSFDKPIIIVPRRRKHGECMDDHQVDLAQELRRAGKATVAFEVEELGDLLKDVSSVKAYQMSEEKRLVSALRDYINGS